jgi:UDP-N-acetylmuramyl pentapeptide phosphotransferase/UDP-N-acetylglucosamine-1-phosphate transferase
MNCRSCQKELPENYDVAWCPVCGKDLVPRETRPDELLSPPTKINWRIFYAVLLAPAVICFASKTAGLDGLAAFTACFGFVLSGIYCGAVLMHRKQLKGFSQIIVGLCLIAVMSFLSLCLCWAGCVGGWGLTRNF